MKHRLAIITSHVIQYQDPLFKLLAQHPEIDLTVLFCSRDGAESYRDHDMRTDVRWDIDPLVGYRHVFLRNLSPGFSFSGLGRTGMYARNFLRLANSGIASAIREGHYDAVLSILGWGSLSALITIEACRRLGVPYLLYGDNSFIPDPSGLRARLHRRMLSRILEGAAGVMVCGTMNAEYYRHFGIDEWRCFFMPWAIDNDRFVAGSSLGPGERVAIREKLGIAPDRTVVIFSGKLIARKNPIHLLQALERSPRPDRLAIVFMGDGEQRELLQHYAQARELEQVHFLGFVNQAEMPKLYGMSDVFALPSGRDPRGTVTNEAMACALPVVISDRVGVYGEGDIVRHGANGFVHHVGDIAALAEHLDRLASDEALRRRMGARSREIITGWSYAEDVEGILKALRFIRESRQKAGCGPVRARPARGVRSAAAP